MGIGKGLKGKGKMMKLFYDFKRKSKKSLSGIDKLHVYWSLFSQVTGKDLLFYLNILLDKLLLDPSLGNHFKYRAQRFGQLKVVDHCRWFKD